MKNLNIEKALKEMMNGDMSRQSTNIKKYTLINVNNCKSNTLNQAINNGKLERNIR